MSDEKIPLFDMGEKEGSKEIHPHIMNRAQSQIADLIAKVFSDRDEGPLILLQARGIHRVLIEAEKSPEASSKEWVRLALITVLVEETL